MNSATPLTLVNKVGGVLHWDAPINTATITTDVLSELSISAPTHWGVVTYPPGASYGPRRLTDWEFVYLMEGDARYRWGAETALAPEGSVVLCRPTESDFFQWDERRRTRHGYFHFTVGRVPADWPACEQWPLVRPPQEGDILRPLFRHLLAGPERGLQTRLTVAHLLASFVSGDVDTDSAPPLVWPEPVERAWAYLHRTLEEHPDVPIALEDLAAAACVTPEHLCRLFGAATGRAPMETVRLARLDRAAVLLSRSNYGVAEIAEQCGFASAFHFSRLFKQHFGASPRAVRERVRAGETPPLPHLLRHR